MLNDIQFFNYYFRYLWTAPDFMKLQTALADTTRGSMKGAYNGACLNGLQCERAGSRTVRVKPGYAVSPSGKFMYHETQANFAFTAPVDFPERALLVMRPKETENNQMTSPTDPNAQVYLNVKQGYEIVMIRGTPGDPCEYPAKGADDVVLCGVWLNPFFNFNGNDDVNYDVRDIPMKNTNQMDSHGITDDRLRPYKINAKTMGIKPAIQGELGYLGQNATRDKPLGFAYVAAGKASKFPRGFFQDAQNVDVLVDFEAGTISGGLTGSFTPYIPEADKYQLAVITIGEADDLVIKFPSIYSYNSKSGVMSDIYDGVAQPDVGYKAIAYYIYYSLDGTTINDSYFYDCRHPGNVIAAAPGVGSGKNLPTTIASSLPYTWTDAYDGRVLLCDFSDQADDTYIYLGMFSGDKPNIKMTIKDVGGNFSRLRVQIGVANGATMKIEGGTGMYLEADFGIWTFKADSDLGRNLWMI